MSDYYSEDFESGKEQFYFEDAFESDCDSMLILGQPIDHFQLADIGAESNSPFLCGANYSSFYDDDGYDSPTTNNPFGTIAEESEDTDSNQATSKPQISPRNRSKAKRTLSKGTSGKDSKLPSFGKSVCSPNETQFKRILVHSERSVISKAGVVTSRVLQDMKHDQFYLQKQLDSALKKVSSYSKEATELTNRLDASAIDTEFQKFRSAIADRDEQIEKLMSDNKALRLINRRQGKVLAEQEQHKEQEAATIQTTDGQVKVLLERVRRTSAYLSECRVKERQLTDRLHHVEKKSAFLQGKYSKLKAQIKVASSADLSLESSVCAVVNQADEQETEDAEQSSGMTMAKLAESNAALQKAITVQRATFKKEVAGLTRSLGTAYAEHTRLQEELTARDKDSRQQMLTLKELTKAYKELKAAHDQLKLASNTLAPRPPSSPKPTSAVSSNHPSSRRSNRSVKAAVLSTGEDEGANNVAGIASAGASRPGVLSAGGEDFGSSMGGCFVTSETYN